MRKFRRWEGGKARGRGWRWQLSGNRFARVLIGPALRENRNWKGSGLFAVRKFVRTEPGRDLNSSWIGIFVRKGAEQNLISSWIGIS